MWVPRMEPKKIKGPAKKMIIQFKKKCINFRPECLFRICALATRKINGFLWATKEKQQPQNNFSETI